MHIPSRAALIPGDVHIRYCLTHSLGEDALHTALALLSDEERARYARFRVDRDRQEFAAAHGLLRTTLSGFSDLRPNDWRFEAGSHGKPALAPGISVLPLSFNLSHARGIVACVVALGADVGLDVELVTRITDWRGIASRYFSASEVAQIDCVAEGDRATRFFELWTLKEAYAKALGVGLSQALDAAAFALADTGAIACTLPPAVDPATWQFALHTPTPTHRLAVAVSDGSRRRWRIHARAFDNDGDAVRPLRTSVG